jgi:predicted dithiol-disulfide oxidoreductase (DUF899 family)
MATSKAEFESSKTDHPRVVSKVEWLAARKELLTQEKEFTRARDALSAKRRELPWVKIEKPYSFDTRGGKKTLADLFEGRSQLIVYHFMFGPEWEEGCPGCSMAADTFNGNAAHLLGRDAALTAVSRAPLSRIEAFKKRMGWQFKWASSSGSDFNFDFGVSFTKEDLAGGKIYNFGTAGFAMEEAPGMSVFYKDARGDIFHTYSTYGRGLEDLLAVYVFLDRVPKGRDEESLPQPMAWVRHHDRYDAGKLIDLK